MSSDGYISCRQVVAGAHQTIYSGLAQCVFNCVKECEKEHGHIHYF